MLYEETLKDEPRPKLVSMASGMGIRNPQQLSKLELIQAMTQVQETVTPQQQTPILPTHSEENPSDQRLRTVPPAKNATQADIMEVCQPWLDRITLTFPSEDQFFMRNIVTGQEDSGTIRQPLRVFPKIAKQVAGDKS